MTSRPEAVQHLPASVPTSVRPPVCLHAGCGHRGRQERPDEADHLLLDFLTRLD